MKAASAWYWARFNKLKLPGGVYSHEGHEFMQEVLEDQSKRQCAMKAPQFAGFSVAYILRCMHEMIHGWLPQGVLYMLPTRDEVSDFSDSKFKPIIDENPQHIGRFVTTDRTGLRKIGNAYVFFVGANMPLKTESGEQKTSAIKSRSVDQFVMDEYDEMPKRARGLALGRMEHSNIQRELYIANPTFPGYGIDSLYYKESDQRYWELYCHACGKWTNMELTFPDCLQRTKDGSVIRACFHCGKEIFTKDGAWVAQYPNKTKDMVGRRISHLVSSFKNPKIILDAWEDPDKLALYYESKTMFYRHCLATGYADLEHALTVEDIYRCCGQEMNGTIPTIGAFGVQPCAMGIDYKLKAINLVIGYPIPDKDAYEIVYVARVNRFQEVHDIAKKFNIKSCVIDARPETRRVRQFQRHEPYRIMLCDYRDQMKIEEKRDDKAGMITIRRTDLCDTSHDLIKQPGKLIIPRRGAEVDVFALQCTQIAKEEVVNEKTGQKDYRYKKLDQDDDYRHALNYFYLACQDSALQMSVMRRMVGSLVRNKAEEKRNKEYDPFSVLKKKAA